MISGPDSTKVASSSRDNADSSHVQTDNAQPFESPDSITWHDALNWLEQQYPRSIPEDVHFHQQASTSAKEVFGQPGWLIDFESSTSSNSGLHTPFSDNFVEEPLNPPGHGIRSWWTHSPRKSKLHRQWREVAEVKEIPVDVLRESPELNKKPEVDKILPLHGSRNCSRDASENISTI